MTGQDGRSAFPGAANSFPRLDVNRRDPIVKAVTDKMVADPGTTSTFRRRNRDLGMQDLSLLQKVLWTTSNNITATASLMQMLPDTSLAMQILVSSILSPKDMVSAELSFKVEQSVFNHELAGPMLDVVRTYFESTYKISDMLPRILEDALFYTGSYPIVILPENSIDEVINSPDRVAMESLRNEFDAHGRLQTIGILGNKRTTQQPGAAADAMGLENFNVTLEHYNRQRETYVPTVESFTLKRKLVEKDGENTKIVEKTASFESLLTIHDNPNVLKIPRLKDKMQQDLIQDLLATKRLSLESGKERGLYGQTPRQEPTGKQASLYRHRRYKHQPVLSLKPGSRLDKESVGHPLVMKLPSEAVIPVHVPSSPEEHLGYFVLLDEQGNPLVRATETDYYRNMGTNLMSNDVTNRLIQKTSAHTVGLQDPLGTHRHDVEQMTQIYTDLVEEELTNRLKNGAYGDGNVQVAKPQEIYRIMFSRALVKMRTQVLYIPAEMMTYVAFDYNENGVGESLMQKSKIIGGLRVMLSFANTMAALKNSIGRTKLGITLDPADDDPTQTVEFIVHEHAKLRQGGFPLGVSNPADIVGYLQNAALELEVSGNTAYPETKVLLEDIQGGRVKPDTELEDLLRKRHISSLGLSPESVDAGANAEFAQAIIQNNLLLAKRVLNYQHRLVSYLTPFIQLYILSSGYLMKELRRVVEENRDKLKSERPTDLEDLNLDEEARRADEVRRREEDTEERPLENHPEYGQRARDVNRRVEDSRRATDADDDVGGEDEDQLSDQELVQLFVEALSVDLPAPDTSTLPNQMKAFDEYAEALEKTLKVYLDTEFLTHNELGELEPYIETAIKAVRAHYLRQWLRNNNVMPELDDLTTFNDDESPALDLLETHENHVQGIGKSLLSYLKALAAYRKKLDSAATPVTTDLGGGSSDAGGDAGSDGSDAGDGLGGDGLGGGDELGDFGADAGTDSATDATGDDLAGTTDLPDFNAGEPGTDGAEPAESGSEGGEEGGDAEAVTADATPAAEPVEAKTEEAKPAEEAKPGAKASLDTVMKETSATEPKADEAKPGAKAHLDTTMKEAQETEPKAEEPKDGAKATLDTVMKEAHSTDAAAEAEDKDDKKGAKATLDETMKEANGHNPSA